ncbi:Uncharacterised protein [Mycobacteroides abscessus subsp. abscessus]|nr:Uncharacterised protein [Mycobacteroides abscessus subsp. abscessus]
MGGQCVEVGVRRPAMAEVGVRRPAMAEVGFRGSAMAVAAAGASVGWRRIPVALYSAALDPGSFRPRE